ncbi:hypothetical protein XENTR_v10001405 [Xenopus tropicalis]|uniref:Hematopoietic SH2 domain containing n=1 Tax=Xenopus tropicalis TaxID=8364 RepID=A0A803JF22_XENTR|nr:hypothetical protein XENTR_v10001405 [Xenopus tropicalis]KAE8632040.1 hypothetical protein XENTR_v10001405 [Xenopus tropicalis]KAE8632041.1 hypothetical protein XENTR_v10001405 [Xenopus tropicalis]
MLSADLEAKEVGIPFQRWPRHSLKQVCSMQDAEDLLKDTVLGCFLIRVGESRIGYSLSYKAPDRYRHFMIDVLNGQNCNMVGDTRIHRTLEDLVMFYSVNPISPYNEFLTEPCGQKTNSNADYQELFEHYNNQVANVETVDNNERYIAFPIPEAKLNSKGAVEPPGNVLEQACPPIPPRRLRASGSLPELPHVPSSMVPRLYPALPQVEPMPHNFVHVTPSQNGHGHKLLKSSSVDSPIFQNKSCAISGDQQTAISSKPFRGRRNILKKAAARVTDGQIGQEFKSLENAVTTHMKHLKDNLGLSGQTELQNTNKNVNQNAKRIIPEEYKKPPPFAPGFN